MKITFAFFLSICVSTHDCQSILCHSGGSGGMVVSHICTLSLKCMDLCLSGGVVMVDRKLFLSVDGREGVGVMMSQVFTLVSLLVRSMSASSPWSPNISSFPSRI